MKVTSCKYITVLGVCDQVIGTLNLALIGRGGPLGGGGLVGRGL